MAIRSYGERSPQIAAGVYVDPAAVVIGSVELAEDVSLWPQAVLRGDVNHIFVGARSNVQDGCVLHVTGPEPSLPSGFPVSVGREVTVGHRAVLHGCKVGDRCLVGIGAVVLDGAVLEPCLMLGAGSLVPPGRRLAGGYLYLGSPARRVRLLSDEELSLLEESAARYLRLKERYLREG